jgi:hypothetical protein
MFEVTEARHPGAIMTYQNRSLSAALGIILVLIAVAALATMLAP